MFMKLSRAFLVLSVFCVSTLLAVSVPSGLELIFKNVESGQRFHPFWPPVSGHQVLGTVVVAKNPGKPQAFFQTIDSPSYRNPSYTKAFIVGTLPLDTPDLTSEKQISAAVAFSQLDSIGKALASSSNAQSLQGNTGAAAPSCPGTAQNPEPAPAPSSQTVSSSTPGSSSPAKAHGAKDVAGNSGGQKPASGTGTTSQGSTAPSQSGSSAAAQKITGIDFCRFTNATSKITGLEVMYYDLPTLDDINSNHALTPSAEKLISKGAKGWIIHRVLVVDSIEYTLTSNTTIDAGFFAKLVAWLPTVSAGYKNQNTVTLKTTSPLTIGYKLWQLGLGVEGKEILTKDDLPKLGIGDDAIESLLFNTKK
jgi:hypothetical protein